jgi:hypothetical protein
MEPRRLVRSSAARVGEPARTPSPRLHQIVGEAAMHFDSRYFAQTCHIDTLHGPRGILSTTARLPVDVRCIPRAVRLTCSL